MATKQQIESFHEFAIFRITDGGAELSMDELYSWWRAIHPTPPELSESVAALRAAFAEIQAGDGGRPARQALRESCQRLGLVIDE